MKKHEYIIVAVPRKRPGNSALTRDGSPYPHADLHGVKPWFASEKEVVEHLKKYG